MIIELDHRCTVATVYDDNRITESVIELTRENLSRVSRERVREICKAVYKAKGLTFPTLTYIGQRATVEQMIDLILTGEIKGIPGTAPSAAVSVQSGHWNPQPAGHTVSEPITRVEDLPIEEPEPNTASRILDEHQTVSAVGRMNSTVVDDLRDVLSRIGIKTQGEAVDRNAVGEIVDERLGGILDAVSSRFGELEELLNARVAALKPEPVTVNHTVTINNAANGQTSVVEGQHERFGKLLQWLSLRMNVWLKGPSGSGKSEAAKAAARELGLEFSEISCCQQTLATAFLGYMDATGTYRRTPFRERYEHGGIMNIDEIGKVNAQTLAVLNSGLGGRGMSFPDGWVAKSETFLCVCSDNTFGEGGDRMYTTSVQLDKASLQRFAFVVWDYDEAFEHRLAGNDEWTDKVQTWRANALRSDLRVVISPRASILGARALAAGIEEEEVCESLVWPGCDKATIAKIQGKAA